MKLYDLAQNYLNLQELLEDSEVPQDMLEASLNEVGEELEDKAENIAKLIKTLAIEAKALKEEETRLSNRRKSLENRSEWLKKYLDSSMKATGKTKFKGKLFSFSIQKNSPGVEILDEELIPERFYIEQEPVLSRENLLKALKDGEDIPGAEIKQTESLRIK